MTTTIDCPTLTDLYDAISTAKVSHKRAILQGDRHAARDIAAYTLRLEAQVDTILDRDLPKVAVQDNSWAAETYAPEDIRFGFHIDRQRYGPRRDRSNG